jgi:hypothetical protein
VKYLLLRGDPSRSSSQKLGLRNKQNWCAHLVENLLFVKRFTHDERAEYLDYGVETEAYTEGCSRNWSYSGHIALSHPAILCRLRRNGIYSPKSRWPTRKMWVSSTPR